MSSTCRARMRWLEQASDGAKRRVEALFRELQASAPLAVRAGVAAAPCARLLRPINVVPDLRQHERVCCQADACIARLMRVLPG